MKTIVCISFLSIIMIPVGIEANTAPFPHQQNLSNPLNPLSPVNPMNNLLKNKKSSESDKKSFLDSMPKEVAENLLIGYAIANCLLFIGLFLITRNKKKSV